MGYLAKSDGFKWERKHTQRAAAAGLGALPISAAAPGVFGAVDAVPGRRMRTAVNVGGGAALGAAAGGVGARYARRALGGALKKVPKGKLLAAGGAIGGGLGAAAGMMRAQNRGYVKKNEDMTLVELGRVAKSIGVSKAFRAHDRDDMAEAKLLGGAHAGYMTGRSKTEPASRSQKIVGAAAGGVSLGAAGAAIGSHIGGIKGLRFVTSKNGNKLMQRSINRGITRGGLAGLAAGAGLGYAANRHRVRFTPDAGQSTSYGPALERHLERHYAKRVDNTE